MNWLRVRELVRKEFIQLFRDRKNRPMLVIAPLIQVSRSSAVRGVLVGLFSIR